MATLSGGEGGNLIKLCKMSRDGHFAITFNSFEIQAIKRNANG